jgi:hypothetical protein
LSCISKTTYRSFGDSCFNVLTPATSLFSLNECGAHVAAVEAEVRDDDLPLVMRHKEKPEYERVEHTQLRAFNLGRMISVAYEKLVGALHIGSISELMKKCHFS